MNALKGPIEDPSREGGKHAKKVAYSAVIKRVLADVLEESDELDRQRATVPELMSELRNFGIAQRRLLIQNSPRYQVWPLAEALLADCRKQWIEDTEHAEALAETALEVADSIKVSGYRERLRSDLKADAWCHIANCRRIRSDLNGATAAFWAADTCLRAGSGDAVERARYLDLRSSLLRAQRQFAMAASAVEEAIQIYHAAGDRAAEGRAQLKQAKLLADSGDPRGAIPVLERAAANIDGEREPRLLLLLKWNLANHLVEDERPEEARRLLPEVRDLVRQHGTTQDRLRILWVDGLVRSALGQTEMAEEALSQVREGFIAAGIAYDVALVSLDLASLYLASARTDEVRRLAAETLPIFASRRVHRELLVAWQLFVDAAEREIATLRLVTDLASRIRNSEGNPPPGAS